MDRRTFLSGLALAAASTTLLVTSEAQAANWVLLGRARVNGQLDHDIVPVGRDKGTFRSLRLKVMGNDLQLFDLTVQYGNGVDDHLPVRSQIRQGGTTRAIDLRANRRFIRDVRLTYGKFANGRGPTFVEVWGLR
jgi:hypothetical protein